MGGYRGVFNIMKLFTTDLLRFGILILSCILSDLEYFETSKLNAWYFKMPYHPPKVKNKLKEIVI